MRAVLVGAAAVVVTAVVVAFVVIPGDEEKGGLGAVPGLWPTPRQSSLTGGDVAIPASALVLDSVGDEPTRRVLVAALKAGGATTVDVAGPDDKRAADLVVKVVKGDLPAENYELTASGREVSLSGGDAAGAYFGAQTFAQLVKKGSLPAVSISDGPGLGARGVVEGFYGPQWSHQEELDTIAWSGRAKFNSYVYAPKADPFHRDDWRSPYPAQRLGELGDLVRESAANHLRFTYALAPGLSICFTADEDWTALTAKLRQLYDAGVRSFSLPMDDIDYKAWHCDGDEDRYGPATPKSAAAAQVDLLNRVQRDFLPSLGKDVAPLQSVPTEYYDIDDSPYKAEYRARLDSRVIMMWTGDGVIPIRITTADAQKADEVWGRKPLVWDNYPVDDFPETAGRLLLGPYGNREPGVAGRLTGIVANPMNQAYASRVALYGIADFTWNPKAYDPEKSLKQYVAGVAGGDAVLAKALTAFIDLNRYGPVPGDSWQPQAPALAGELDAFRKAWSGGDRRGAVDRLRAYADVLSSIPEQIKGTDFARDAKEWLDATAVWAQALQAALDGLEQRVGGVGAEEVAAEKFAEVGELVAEAQALPSPPGRTNVEGPIKIGDGVLDAFLAAAPEL
ncbi:beta-N-acetylglucosaminidase domain-containing protein [Actinosynnema sp. NPDC020468]|uniref:beta-N-acetylglucosaminidase domain-containing protein n=1 Tax=Actinosynnema sp. NPDC020468 TaxID=3154488 RepID=UPI0033DA0825